MAFGIGVVLFSLDGARDVDANRRTVAAQLAPMTRDDELLAVLDDTTIVLIVGAATEEALSATAARFRGLAYLVATEHGPMPIDVSWAINHL